MSQFLEKINVCSIDLAQGEQFDEVDAALSALAFRDERLRLAQPLGDFCLGEPSQPPRLPETHQKTLIASAIFRLRQQGQIRP